MDKILIAVFVMALFFAIGGPTIELLMMQWEEATDHRLSKTKRFFTNAIYLFCIVFIVGFLLACMIKVVKMLFLLT